MPRRFHRPALAALAAGAVFATSVLADVLPPPTYVAGLWFYAYSRYQPGHGVITRPIALRDCQDGHANCRAAKAAKVLDAEVVSVNGVAGADPSAVLSQPHPPARVVVVFRVSSTNGPTRLTSVTFTPGG